MKRIVFGVAINSLE